MTGLTLSETARGSIIYNGLLTAVTDTSRYYKQKLLRTYPRIHYAELRQNYVEKWTLSQFCAFLIYATVVVRPLVFKKYGNNN